MILRDPSKPSRLGDSPLLFSIESGRLGIHPDAPHPIATNQVARLVWPYMTQISNHSDADISSLAADSSLARGPVDAVIFLNVFDLKLWV